MLVRHRERTFRLNDHDYMDLHWANNIVFEFVKNYFVAFVTRFEYGKDALLITIKIVHIVPATMKVVANKTSEHLSMSFFTS